MRNTHAIHLRAGTVVITSEESQRVQRFIARVGWREAATRLGIGPMTLDAARDRGGMQRATKERLMAALDREEAA